jgi:hypothetical protein
MYSRQEASQLRQEFWTAFGQYMQPVQSAEGLKVNWINYKTGEKGIVFRMQAGPRQAMISIDITHSDEGIRQLYYEQLLELKKPLEAALGEEWQWSPEAYDEYGKPLSRISKTLDEVSIFRREDWPALISFFKPRIMALDEFWSSAKYAFESLRS